MVWTSERKKPSYLQGVVDGKVVFTRSVDVRGIPFSATNQMVRVGDHSYFLSSGLEYDETNLIDWDASTCRVTAVPLDGVIAPFGMAGDGSRFFTTFTVNGEMQFRRFDKTGAITAKKAIAGTYDTADALVLSDSALYAFVSGDTTEASDTCRLLEFDPDTLELRSDRRLPFALAPISSAVLHDGSLIYPLTNDDRSDTPLQSLGVLDVKSFKATRIDLGADEPTFLRLAGDVLYVSHNPGPWGTDPRHISAVDLKTSKVKGYDLGADPYDIRLNTAGDRLYAITRPDWDKWEYELETIRTDTMERVSSQSLIVPAKSYGPGDPITP